MISSVYTDSSLNSVNLHDQPRLQQQQLYGTDNQKLLNNLYSGSIFYSGSGTNQLLRNPNGNILPPGDL